MPTLQLPERIYRRGKRTNRKLYGERNRHSPEDSGQEQSVQVEGEHIDSLRTMGMGTEQEVGRTTNNN